MMQSLVPEKKKMEKKKNGRERINHVAVVK